MLEEIKNISLCTLGNKNIVVFWSEKEVMLMPEDFLTQICSDINNGTEEDFKFGEAFILTTKMLFGSHPKEMIIGQFERADFKSLDSLVSVDHVTTEVLQSALSSAKETEPVSLVEILGLHKEKYVIDGSYRDHAKVVIFLDTSSVDKDNDEGVFMFGDYYGNLTVYGNTEFQFDDTTIEGQFPTIEYNQTANLGGFEHIPDQFASCKAYDVTELVKEGKTVNLSPQDKKDLFKKEGVPVLSLKNYGKMQ